MKKFKKFLSGLGDFLFTWLPTVINILCCTIAVFPWKDLFNAEVSFISIILDENAVIATLFLTYTIVVAKNNYDLNKKIAKNLNKIKRVNADDLLIVRNELESLESIFENAQKVSFSGGHLSTVIISHQDALNNFLRKKKVARFILPNPLEDRLMKQYAQKLMVNTTVNEFKDKVLLSLSSIKRYIDDGFDIDVRLYDDIPAFGLQIIESSLESKINVELYTLQTELSERILFPVERSSSGETYERFIQQFTILWDSSKKIEDVEGLVEILEQKANK